jgi:hypothetical protein
MNDRAAGLRNLNRAMVTGPVDGLSNSGAYRA